jgi:hypothetical protein
VADVLARQLPELDQESAGIRDLRPKLARLRLKEKYLEVRRHTWQAEQTSFGRGLAEQDLLWVRLHKECGTSGLENNNSAGCALIFLVRVSSKPLPQ